MTISNNLSIMNIESLLNIGKVLTYGGKMKTVITYGTFDLFHEGHYNILKRAKEQGDYLIVGVTSENYDKSRGKLNVQQSLVERIENVKNSGFADKIIVEEYYGQKIEDIKKYNVDTFVIGSDWIGKFDYLKEYCDVVYLERTRGVSSTQLRNKQNGIIKLGCVGSGRIARRMCIESKYVSGISFDYIFDRNIDKAIKFAEDNDLTFFTDDYDKLLKEVDAVYIAIPHPFHYEYAKKALESGKHVLCEKPMTLTKKETKKLYEIAKKNNVVLYEAIKTAYAPGFKRMVAIAKSGIIGEIRDVDATFTKLMENHELREFDKAQGGGSVNELSTYPLIGIFKLLGCNYDDISFVTYKDQNDVDIYTKIFLKYKNATATANVGLGVKREGEMIVSGTQGYIYVPAPWWKTEYFEVRFENPQNNQKYFIKFEEDGLRYEVAEFLSTITHNTPNISLSEEESIAIAEVIEKFNNNKITK